MGRKKRNRSGDNRGISKAAQRQAMDLTTQLLEKCSKLPGGGNEWDEYLEINSLVKKIIDLQKGNQTVTVPRQQCFPEFLDWLLASGVNVDNVDIDTFPGCDCGLKAKHDIKKSEAFITIPRKLMMSPETAAKTVLGPLIKDDQILQAMPNIALSLHLLCERNNEESFWQPYLQILPASYTIPLYFEPEEMLLLKGCAALTDALSHYRNIARQYAYFSKLFQAHPLTQRLPIKNNFTYEDYRWAVSTVMTRQNQIPTSEGSRMTFALIPLMDMCNHCEGEHSTDYDVSGDCSVCYAVKDFNSGEQIFMFYGPRSSGDLLIHNGFNYPDNLHDKVKIKLGISKNDPLYSLKATILSNNGVKHTGSFSLINEDVPIPIDLLCFLRVFCMNEELLRSMLDNESSQIADQLTDIDESISAENEQKCWSFLHTRASLLLKAYSSTIQDDDDLLKSDSLSTHATLCIQLRQSEKYILQRTVNFATKKLKGIKASEQTLPKEDVSNAETSSSSVISDN